MSNENIEKRETVTFVGQTDNKGMINASAMAAAFKRRPADWLRMKSTKEFFSSLSAMKNISVGKLVTRVKNAESKAYETWIDEDAALEFARWLSPSFAIWNNQYTKQFLLSGNGKISNDSDSLLQFASQFVGEIHQTHNLIEDQTRKAFYHDTILQSRTLIPTTVIAKELGMSARALNKHLHERKIIYKNNAHWVLYSDYQGKGYTGTKTAVYIDSSGKYQTNIHTYWTEKGREFIHELFQGRQQIA